MPGMCRARPALGWCGPLLDGPAVEEESATVCIRTPVNQLKGRCYHTNVKARVEVTFYPQSQARSSLPLRRLLLKIGDSLLFALAQLRQRELHRHAARDRGADCFLREQPSRSFALGRRVGMDALPRGYALSAPD